MSMKAIGHVTHKLSNSLIIIGAIGLLVMTAIVTWQVFGRYVLRQSPDWSEQTALILMIWYVLFAAAAGVRQGFHIRIEAFENALPPSIGMSMRMISNVVVGLCGLAMLIWGTMLVIGTWSHVVPTLGISRGAVYIALPISGALIALFSIERMILECTEESEQMQEKA